MKAKWSNYDVEIISDLEIPEKIRHYKLKQVELLTLNKALENITYPFKFNNMHAFSFSVIEDEQKERFIVFPKPYINPKIAKRVHIFSDSKSNDVIETRETNERGVFYSFYNRDSVKGKRIDGAMDIENDLVKLKSYFMFQYSK